MAKMAYAAPAAPVRTPRAVEYDLFARFTQRLATAAQAGGEGFSGLAGALNDNLRLWTAIAADVADPGNELPRDLRARLFYLSEFTRAHTSRVLAGKAGADALIDINRAVMRGLRGEGGAG